MFGRWDVVSLLLAKCEYPADQGDSCGSTPLMDALRSGHVNVAKILIDEGKVGASLHTVTTIPVTPVRGQLRAGKGYGISCRDLGASFKNSKKLDPYLIAAASWPRAILSSVCPVQRGVHVASYMLVLHQSGQGGGGCFMYLAPPAYRYADNILSKGLSLSSFEANVSALDSLGRSALHLAAEAGEIGAVRFLVRDCGVSVHLLTENTHQSAVHHAAKVGQLIVFVNAK
jgi:ankyrin repeat protein